MTDYYVDSSALVKQYISEKGTIWIRGLLQPSVGNSFYTVSITGAEIIATLFRKARGGLTTISAARAAATAFRADWRQRYIIMHITPNLVEEAMGLAEKRYLRGYDAIHLAAALEVQRSVQSVGLSPLIFVSADVQQLQAAQAEGLLVENSDNYV